MNGILIESNMRANTNYLKHVNSMDSKIETAEIIRDLCEGYQDEDLTREAQLYTGIGLGEESDDILRSIRMSGIPTLKM